MMSLKKKPNDSLEFNVLLGSVPNDISDSLFVNKLSQIGFRKIILSDKKQGELREIFVDKKRNSEPKVALKPMFNDILIFKKENKIVGFSKLSIRYKQSRIIGSKLNSENFPTDFEHIEIEKILYEK